MRTCPSTLGYEGMGLPGLLGCRAAHGIKCVIDVRETPFSPKRGFSKGPLSRALDARGIRYVHLKELGTPRPVRDAVKSDGDYDKVFHQMQEYLATQPEAIDRACDYLSRMTCCLMCYERSADMRHRKLVAQIVRARVGNRPSIALL